MPPRRLPARWGLGSLHLDWRLLAMVLAIYTLVTLRANQQAGRLGNGWVLVACFITPFVHLAAITWVAPLAWRLRGSRGNLLGFLQGLVISLVATEAASVAAAGIDIWLMHLAGVESPQKARILTAYLVVVGPAMILAGGLIEARARAMDENRTIRQEALVAKTRLLQSQLHPHVLFNALNNLAELIHKDPPQAERSVMHLADLLRRILQATENPTFALLEERALVENYLFIEGLRLGARLSLAWEWDSLLDHLQVPPLLLQPLVENAIKHGISPTREGGRLIVRARRRNGGLELQVWNSGAPFKPGPQAGIGLQNLEGRLHLQYGPSASFKVGPADNGTLATIRVPDILLR